MAETIGRRTIQGIAPFTAPPKLDAQGNPVTRRPEGKPLINGPLDAIIRLFDPTRLQRLPNALPVERYLFDYNLTVPADKRIGIAPIDNEITVRIDGKDKKISLTPAERQKATRNAAEAALMMLGQGWESMPRNIEGAEQIREAFRKAQAQERARIRMEKLME